MSMSVKDLQNPLEFLGLNHVGATVSTLIDATASALNRKPADAQREPNLGVFTFLMRPIMMRHSQRMRYAGTNTTLMSLPPKVSSQSSDWTYCSLQRGITYLIRRFHYFTSSASFV